jgi:hypothetical protein
VHAVAREQFRVFLEIPIKVWACGQVIVCGELVYGFQEGGVDLPAGFR